MQQGLHESASMLHYTDISHLVYITVHLIYRSTHVTIIRWYLYRLCKPRITSGYTFHFRSKTFRVMKTVSENAFFFLTSQNQVTTLYLLVTTVPTCWTASAYRCLASHPNLSPTHCHPTWNASSDPFPFNTFVNAEFCFQAPTPRFPVSNSYTYFQRAIKPHRITTFRLCPM